MTKNILVTGGPVGAKLDQVKIVTNKFKGGRMAQLAGELAAGANVTFLCTKDTIHPTGWVAEGVPLPNVVYHDGFHDYMEKVIELSKEMDAVILGAAVANLIPVAYFAKPEMIGAFNSAPTVGERIPMPLKDKFPSHNYKPGDRIFMEWTIAPRVIDEVKKHMPKTGHLFGFKLLAGQPHDELIRAAYEVLLSSKATAVIANDPTQGLDTKHIVTKERGVHTIDVGELAPWILQVLDDEYYQTAVAYTWGSDEQKTRAENLLWDGVDKSQFVKVEGGHVFGTIAVRIPDGHYPWVRNPFYTTRRGKDETDGVVAVEFVDHDRKIVQTCGGKATLNAPLLGWIFQQYPQVHRIHHYHFPEASLPVYPYAPPGTFRDSVRGLSCKSFNIEGHGCFLLLDKEGNVLQ